MDKRIDYISFEEFQKIYKAEKSKEMKLILMLGFGSGLRISEILGLGKEKSCCCNADIIRERKLVEGGKRIVLICSECKKIVDKNNTRHSTTEWKIPPLTKEQIDLAKHQIKIDIAKGGKWRIAITPPTLNESFLNLLPIKTPRRTVQWRFAQLTKKILNKKMSVHTLRHGFGNYQVNVLKMPLPIVQQMMGHSRLDTTGIYTKANPEQAIQMAWNAMTGET